MRNMVVKCLGFHLVCISHLFVVLSIYERERERVEAHILDIVSE